MFNAVQWSRILAAEIWRGERWPPFQSLAGLNNEEVVRAKLHHVVAQLLPRAQAPAAGRALDVIRSPEVDPLRVLDATEILVATLLPGTYASAEALLDAAAGELGGVVELLIVQSIAGRLGCWAVRSDELDDSRIAHVLVRRVGAREDTQRAALLEVGRQLYKSGDFERAALCFLDADRIERTPFGLYQVAIALWRAERHPAALWTIRAALLEPPHRFETPELLAQSIRAESSLRRMVEGRGAFGPEELARAAALAQAVGQSVLRPPARPTLM
ncbi:MAG: hypothetical protein IT384_02030 [Deltaproteobacteria bacterium]|nr:hypothetical protein [Deltaproteobacteria bacterium]